MKLLLLILLLITPISSDLIQQNTGHAIYTPITSVYKPRNVIGYTLTGDSINTDNDGKTGNPENMWLTGYSYYYYNGHWYRKDDKNKWERWSSVLDWGWLWYDWYDVSQPTNPILYYETKPTPIGPINCLLVFSLLYFIYLRKYGKKISLN